MDEATKALAQIARRQLDEAADHIAALQSQNRKLVEALRTISGAAQLVDGDWISTPEAIIARAALADHQKIMEAK